MSSLVTSYIHTHTWVLCPWCVCVCVASVTCVRGQERGTMRSSPGRAQGLRENKMTEGHMEEERAHTRGHVNAEKIISRLCRPKLETLCRYITRFLATCVCPPIAEGHQRISCLLKPRRRTRAGWYGPIKRKKYRSYHRVLLWLSARPALVSLVRSPFACEITSYVPAQAFHIV